MLTFASQLLIFVVPLFTVILLLSMLLGIVGDAAVVQIQESRKNKTKLYVLGRMLLTQFEPYLLRGRRGPFSIIKHLQTNVSVNTILTGICVPQDEGFIGVSQDNLAKEEATVVADRHEGGRSEVNTETSTAGPVTEAVRRCAAVNTVANRSRKSEDGASSTPIPARSSRSSRKSEDGVPSTPIQARSSMKASQNSGGLHSQRPPAADEQKSSWRTPRARRQVTLQAFKKAGKLYDPWALQCILKQLRHTKDGGDQVRGDVRQLLPGDSDVRALAVALAKDMLVMEHQNGNAQVTRANLQRLSNNLEKASPASPKLSRSTMLNKGKITAHQHQLLEVDDLHMPEKEEIKDPASTEPRKTLFGGHREEESMAQIRQSRAIMAKSKALRAVVMMDRMEEATDQLEQLEERLEQSCERLVAIQEGIAEHDKRLPIIPYSKCRIEAMDGRGGPIEKGRVEVALKHIQQKNNR
ncbi:hypothetical protein CYMTET_19597 [Cymbomonas tetramitiformis]|uniref:Uncharacterized protein n=1 Tax=Cymbomonas tetramitiformis TaxID=36881 RepID=A0AAE0L513_9CHLO|nr:hypothetical protein CYMTET_19597 [Cymbomonas tetramitiformis]